jgi:hypothetical protein
MYSIGDPITGKKTDERFEICEDADIAAIEASVDGRVWATWSEEDGEIISLVFQQRVFD